MVDGHPGGDDPAAAGRLRAQARMAAALGHGDRAEALAAQAEQLEAGLGATVPGSPLPGANLPAYVRSEKSVSFWSAPLGRWLTHRFGSEVLGVQVSDRGVLAWSRNVAVLFDAESGLILEPLRIGDAIRDGDLWRG